MCYYNGQKVTKAEYIELMQLEKYIADIQELKRPTVLGPESPQMVVLKPNADKSDFDVTTMRWGFIPDGIVNMEQVKKFENGYKKQDGTFQTGYDTENARGEELFWINPKTNKKKIYYDSALDRRCLIISNQYYEWHHVYRTNKRTGEPLKTPDKYPFAIKVKDREYFYMAALWNPWTDQDTGETIETLTMVTTNANPLAAKIHNSKKRMPTILPDQLAWEWMMSDIDQEGINKLAVFQFPEEHMEAFSINQKFQFTGEDPYPVTYPELAGIFNSGESNASQMSLF
ncbi:SOS response-associated peptidase [Dyadobacter sp. CY323]|uniref:SOS response-associated peptidase n=1 Tax=Dyadobacter sp. CY323 TaxID=2907302 RepID=UPI001F2E9A82|nr:SOS response-associated peptidase family protein [Dyadobacter sp. CY323]MCE6988147.1 SOS response-associated peptidase [Dyadobacter sp. CY323]